MKVKIWMNNRPYLFITDNPQLLDHITQTWEDYEYLGAVTWQP